MDISNKFIKMCNCSEIQDIIPKMIDDTGIKYIDGTAHVLKYHIGVGELIWLPRQDQLQEMVDLDIWELATDLDEFIYTKDRDLPSKPVRGLKSMEQLWLAYVMYEKFNKVWDDKQEEWIKP